MNSTTQRRVARASLLLLVFSLAWAQTEALKPRASSTEYSARAGTNGVWIGVAVAPPHRDLVVLEVAVYPPPTGSANVTLNDFALSINNGAMVVKPLAPPDIPPDRILAKGLITKPTAGYLYFRVPIPREKRSSAELEYFGAPRILRVKLPAV